MHSSTADPPSKPKIVVGEYSRMETGGWITLGLGIIGVTVLLCVGILTHATLPTGFASLTMGLFISGCILLVGRLVLRKQDQMRVELEDHRADHQGSALDVADIAAIKQHVAESYTLLARIDIAFGPDWLEAVVAEAVRRVVAELRNPTPPPTPSAPAQAVAVQNGHPPRDAAWMADMAESLRIGREIEQRRGQA
jgi:hypothetical protein